MSDPKKASATGLFKMAWRNIWRNRRRTLVTVGAMTLALTVLILYTGLVEGYLRNMERNMLDLELGDVQAHAGDYRDRPSIYTRIEDPNDFLTRLDERGFERHGAPLGRRTHCRRRIFGRSDAPRRRYRAGQAGQ